MTVICCPSCGGEMSLDVLVAHNELRRVLFDLLEKSLSCGSLVLRYVGLFRPAKNRMSADRFAKLIGQLLPDIQREAITHKGRDWPVPVDAWNAGLEAMLEKASAGKLQLPLENHNYLYAVLVGMADKAEAQAESQREEERRHSASLVVAHTGPVAVTEAVKKGVPEHIRQQLDELRRGAPVKEVNRA